MSLGYGTAYQVVARCIRATGKLPKDRQIKLTHKLEEVRITTQLLADGVCDRIITSNQIGLPSLEPTAYSMDGNLLSGVSPSSTVGSVVETVGDNANPV